MGRTLAFVLGAAGAAFAVFWLMRTAPPATTPPAPPPPVAQQPRVVPPKPPVASSPPEEAPAAKEVPPPAAEESLLDQCFGCYVGGQKTGWVRVEAHRAAPGRIALREEHLSRSASEIAHMTRETRLDLDATLDDADLSVLEMHIVERELSRKTTIDIVWEEDGYTVTTTLDGRSQSRRLLGTGGVCGSNDLLLMRLAAQGKLSPGTETKFQEFDLGVPRAVEKVVKTKRVDPWEVEFDVVRATLDARGVVSRAMVAGEELRAEPPDTAKRMPRGTVTMRDEVSLDFAFPRFDALDEVVLEARVVGDKDGDLFQETEYQRVAFRSEGKDGIYTLTMLPYRKKEAAERASKEPAGDLAEFLEPTPMVQCDDPGIIAKAKEIVAGIEDKTEQVRALSAWIHVNLGKRYTEVGSLSAKETLKEMGGDCSEHATLFDAFARALGIPVRECSGYVFLTTEGGRHAWSQVWIDGRWVHVDTVVNCVGADPRYILMSKHQAGHARDLTIGRRNVALETHPPRIRVASFIAWGKLWAPDDARESVKTKDGVFESPLLGLTLRLPGGWEAAGGEAALATATLRRGDFVMQMRTIPYAWEALRTMLGTGGSKWKEMPLGNQQAGSARRTGYRRGRVSDGSLDATWAVPMGGSLTLYITMQGDGAAARAAFAEAEQLLGGMELRERGD